MSTYQISIRGDALAFEGTYRGELTITEDFGQHVVVDGDHAVAIVPTRKDRLTIVLCGARDPTPEQACATVIADVTPEIDRVSHGHRLAVEYAIATGVEELAELRRHPPAPRDEAAFARWHEHRSVLGVGLASLRDYARRWTR